MMTPAQIDADVKKLISVVCPDSVPIYLPVEPGIRTSDRMFSSGS